MCSSIKAERIEFLALNLCNSVVRVLNFCKSVSLFLDLGVSLMMCAYDEF